MMYREKSEKCWLLSRYPQKKILCWKCRGFPKRSKTLSYLPPRQHILFTLSKNCNNLLSSNLTKQLGCRIVFLLKISGLTDVFNVYKWTLLPSGVASIPLFMICFVKSQGRLKTQTLTFKTGHSTSQCKITKTTPTELTERHKFLARLQKTPVSWARIRPR